VPGIETDLGRGIGNDLDEQVGIPQATGRSHSAGAVQHDQAPSVAVSPDDGRVPA
jgi:hypothetical protein